MRSVHEEAGRDDVAAATARASRLEELTAMPGSCHVSKVGGQRGDTAWRPGLREWAMPRKSSQEGTRPECLVLWLVEARTSLLAEENRHASGVACPYISASVPPPWPTITGRTCPCEWAVVHIPPQPSDLAPCAWTSL